MYDMKRAAHVAAPLSASIVRELRRCAADEAWMRGYRDWRRSRSPSPVSPACTCSRSGS